MSIKSLTEKLVAICVISVAPLAVIQGAATRAVAQMPAYQDVTASVTTTVHSPLVDYSPANTAKSAECLPKLGEYTRTEACWSTKLKVTYRVLHHEIGTLKFVLVQSIQLQIIGRDFTEHDAITNAKTSGLTNPAYLSISASCGNQCHAASHWHPGTRIEKGSKGTISYSDSVMSGGIDLELTQYRGSVKLINGHHSNPLKWKSPLYFRCDDTLKGQGAGCVFPAFTPILTSMTKVADIAKNIRRIQNNGPGHYGRLGSGNPLHRLIDEAQQRRNNRIACSKKVTGPRPSGKSCDEYPFASTYEGGHSLPAPDRGWAWVPTGQQDRQGGLIRTFYYGDRVLNLDPFYVKV